MNVGETIENLITTDNYLNERIKLSDEFIEMMKFMFSEKYKLIEEKEENFQKVITNFKEWEKEINV